MKLAPFPSPLRPARKPPLLPAELRLVLMIAGSVATFLGVASIVVFGLSAARLLFAAGGITVLSAAWPTRRERSPL